MISSGTSSARAQALALGEKRYIGAACPRAGHSGERYTINGACAACSYERHRTRRAENPAKEREQQRALRAKNPEKHRDQMRAMREANPEKDREQQRARRAANPAKHNEQKRAWRAANTEKDREQSRASKRRHPGTGRANTSKRRAMKLAQRCTCCTDAHIAEFHKQAALCGRGAEVDHIVQLSLGGPDCAKNLVALTYEDHKEKTKLDAKERAESRRRNKLLHSWSRFGAAVEMTP